MKKCTALMLILTPARVSQRILAYAAVFDMWYNLLG